MIGDKDDYYSSSLILLAGLAGAVPRGSERLAAIRYCGPPRIDAGWPRGSLKRLPVSVTLSPWRSPIPTGLNR